MVSRREIREAEQDARPIPTEERQRGNPLSSPFGTSMKAIGSQYLDSNDFGFGGMMSPPPRKANGTEGYLGSSQSTHVSRLNTSSSPAESWVESTAPKAQNSSTYSIEQVCNAIIKVTRKPIAQVRDVCHKLELQDGAMNVKDVVTVLRTLGVRNTTGKTLEVMNAIATAQEPSKANAVTRY